MKIKTIGLQTMMLLICFFSCYTVSYAGMGATEQSMKHQLKQHTNEQTLSKKGKKQLKKLLQKPNEIKKQNKKRGFLGMLIGGVFILGGAFITLAGVLGSFTMLIILGLIAALAGVFIFIRGLIRVIF